MAFDPVADSMYEGNTGASSVVAGAPVGETVGGYGPPPGLIENYQTQRGNLGADLGWNMTTLGNDRSRLYEDRNLDRQYNTAHAGMATPGAYFGLGASAASGRNQRAAALANAIRGINAQAGQYGLDRGAEDIDAAMQSAALSHQRSLQDLTWQAQQAQANHGLRYALGLISPLDYLTGGF